MKGIAMQRKWDRHEILQLLTLSATLAGLSITALTIFKKQGADRIRRDDCRRYTGCGVAGFFAGDLFIFFSLRTRHPSLATKLELIGDVIFLVALTGMVATGFIILYTVW
jgi:hypothetical protein